MLVLNQPDVLPSILSIADVPEQRLELGLYGSYISAVHRIIRRGEDRLDFVPSQLSAAMMDAFGAVHARVGGFIETSCGQWRQYAAGAKQAVVLLSRAATVKPSMASLVRAVRRVKAFFISQKVNLRNAP